MIVVVGAGVAGLCTALELQRAGADCLLIDPGPFGGNASGVAAGMLAPAFESVLDPASQGRFELLRAGRDLWLEGEAEVRRDGALWVGDAGEAERLAGALRAQEAAAERVGTQDLRSAWPDLAPEVAAGVFAPDDWRLEPGPALRAILAAFRRAGGRLKTADVQAVQPDGVLVQGGRVAADAVVVCAGHAAVRFAAAAPELAVLAPIRGDLVRFPGHAPRSGPTLRHAGGYIVPSDGGPVAGATMIEGVCNLEPTSAASQQAAAAAIVLPSLGGAPFEAGAGIRAATPDGLPLVGRSAGGVWLATGFRRNGWTLAPLAGRIVAAGLAGADPGPWAHALRPDRVLVA